MNYCKSFVTVLVIIFLALPAYAYDLKRAKNNLAHEFASCSAFYSFLSIVPNLQSSTVEQTKKSAEVCAEMSIYLTNKKLTYARIELELKEMPKKIERSWDNLSIVLNEYGELCSELKKNPVQRLDYWINKEEN